MDGCVMDKYVISFYFLGLLLMNVKVGKDRLLIKKMSF